MADINVYKLKDKLYPAAKALFMIGETLVDVSKQHISAEDAIEKIRSYMYDADVIGSRYRVDALIAECTESLVCNAFDNEHTEWIKEYLKQQGGLMLTDLDAPSIEITYPACCDGCSNNPKNGGSGTCNCTLPYMQNPIMYNTGDNCMVNNIDGNMYFVDDIDALNHYGVNANTISKAVERTKKYIKE